MSISFKEELSRAISTLPKFKVITYIDGFNLYFGIRNQAIKKGSLEAPDPAWYRYMWLNLHAMCGRLLTNRQELVAIKYFTAPIIGGKGKIERQNVYLDALRTLPKTEIILGRFEPERKPCSGCGTTNIHPQEKKTDVNIATALICDALDEKYDTAILITGDSDMVPAVQAVKRIKPGKRVIAAFPPQRYSKELADATGFEPLGIWENLLRKSLFPPVIKRENLPDIVRPQKYSGTARCTTTETTSAEPAAATHN